MVFFMLFIYTVAILAQESEEVFPSDVLLLPSSKPESGLREYPSGCFTSNREGTDCMDGSSRPCCEANAGTGN